MTLANFMTNTQQSTAVRGLFVAKPGVGKTWNALMAPNSLLIDCERSAQVYRGQFQNMTRPIYDWLEFKQIINALITEPQPPATIFIDTIGAVIKGLIDHITQLDKKCSPTSTLTLIHGGWGAGANIVRNNIEKWILEPLNKLVDRGINVILLSHVTTEKTPNISDPNAEKLVPDMHHKSFPPMFIKWVDFYCEGVLNINKTRTVNTKATNIIELKNRFNLPDKMNLDWNEIFYYIEQGKQRNLQAQ